MAARLFPSSAPFRPELDQQARLRDLVPDTGGDDSERAVAFFRTSLEAGGFLDASEAAEALADYRTTRPVWRGVLLAEANSLCRQGLPVYAGMAGPLGGGLDWSALPSDAHQDLLYRLRPHRFGFLPRLAMASCLGADTLTALQATLETWIRRSDEAEGASEAYFSNLVVIYRVLAITWAAPFLVVRAESGDRTAASLCLQLFRILAADIRFLVPRLGQSAPNNHLLADRFAGWLLAACWPALLPPAVAADMAGLEAAWQAELARQFAADGTSFEQSLHYHELGCEMAMGYFALACRRGAPPASPTLGLVARMLRLQAALADRQGRGFSLGDATEDPLLPLDAGAGWARGAWRELYSDLFDPAFQATDEDAEGAERAFWILTSLKAVRRPLQVVLEPPGAVAAFPVHGYIAFRDETRDDFLLFRTGPRPGTDVAPGHAMSDLLSVYWTVAGQPLLEPAGTYSYAGFSQPPGGGPENPRHYFRSPAAHNGPVLTGHDPLGAVRGRFRSTDSGARVVTRWRSLDGVLGWAEGRLTEPGPLDGWRRGALRVAGQPVVIYDRLPALPDRAERAVHWQFSPEAKVAPQPGGLVRVAAGPLTAYMRASGGIAGIECVKGIVAPAGGWVSRRYGELTAAPQLICRLRHDTAAVAFAAGLADEAEPDAVDAQAVGDDGLLVVLRRGADCCLAIIGSFRGRLPGSEQEVDFDGEAAWVEMAGDGGCVGVRALGARRLALAGLYYRAGAAAGAITPVVEGWRLLAWRQDDEGLSAHWRRIGFQSE